MKNGHTAVKEFLEKKERFADFFNGNLFQGQQVVLPEELEVIKGESDILVEDKNLSAKKVQRYRDIVMRWKKEVYLVILACEVQTKVNYAMPIRRMEYDCLSYKEQAKQIWNARGGEKVTDAELLSQFRKDDKLVPVITVVFYYGTEEWDGSKDLYGMFPEYFGMEEDLIKKYIPNYWINIIEADSIEDVECFQTDLREIFGLMKCRKDQGRLVKYIREHEDYFQHVDSEKYYAIGALLQSERILKEEVKRGKEEGEMDMCKALEDLYQEGCEKGRLDKLIEQVQKKLAKGLNAQEIAETLEENIEDIEMLIKQLQEQGEL